MKTNEATYQAQQFATRAGVTVRTLHHYDRLGLLRPSGYTAAGYRLYRESDLGRLQQIVTLKFIGFSLKEIKVLLKQNGRDLATALRRQRIIINQKMHHLGMAVEAIEKAEQVISHEEPDWEAFKKIIGVLRIVEAALKALSSATFSNDHLRLGVFKSGDVDSTVAV